MHESIYLQSTINGYSGSQFCSGLLFGLRGSNLLIRVGRELETMFRPGM